MPQLARAVPPSLSTGTIPSGPPPRPQRSTRTRRVRPRSSTVPPLSPSLSPPSPGKQSQHDKRFNAGNSTSTSTGAAAITVRGVGGEVCRSTSRSSPDDAGALPLGMSMSLLLVLLTVSSGAAPAAAAAAAAAAVASSPSSSSSSLTPRSPPPVPRFPSCSASITTAPLAFCLPPATTTMGHSLRGWSSGAPRPPRLRKRSSAAVAVSAAPLSNGRESSGGVRCCWSSGSEAPLPSSSSSSSSSLWTLREDSQSGGGSFCGCGAGGGGGRGGPGWGGIGGWDRSGRTRRSRRRVYKASMGRADSVGSGGSGCESAEDMTFRSHDVGGRAGEAGWDVEWDGDMELLSNFGFNDHGQADADDYGRGGMVAGDDGGGGVMASLSERDAARLEEVGIMVKELEESSEETGGLGPSAPAAVVRSPFPAGPLSYGEPDAPASDDDEPKLAGPRKAHFVGSSPENNARLRTSCGDPVFFGQLAELIHGLHRQSGSRKFLSHAEEMELGARVQRYRQLIEAQEKAEKESGSRPSLLEVAFSFGLSEAEFSTVMQDGMEARQKLVVCNLALVVSLSNKYKRSHYGCGCLQTLIQEGTIGLIRAAERYDPGKGFRFTTYAIWWIEARLRISVQTEERLIHVPMWVKNKFNVINRSIPKLKEALGREPTPEEVAKQVAIDTDSKVVVTPKRVKELQTWVDFHRQHESLDSPLQVGTRLPPDCSTLEHGVTAPEPSTESTSELEIQRDFLESCLSQDLSRIQRKILRMKVGLGGEKGKNRQEISRALKMPFNNVISEERKAFYKLRGLQRGGGYPSFEELK